MNGLRLKKFINMPLKTISKFKKPLLKKYLFEDGIYYRKKTG